MTLYDPKDRFHSKRDWFEIGQQVRKQAPWAELGNLTLNPGHRDPLGILRRQDEKRIQDLVPLRRERMSQSPFTFYRGTAAVMAADLADQPHSGIPVASCGDAHISNFGIFASPLRTLLFDLNDFDEAAWAPWEWDVKRLVASVILGGQATSRPEAVILGAAQEAVRAYLATISSTTAVSPLERYFVHFDPVSILQYLDDQSRHALKDAIKQANKKTGERVVHRLTVDEGAGKDRFREDPPRMTRPDAGVLARVHDAYDQYEKSSSVDIRVLLSQFEVADVARRVVGVGSVGTRCYIALLRSGDDDRMILQVKEASESVLIEYGKIAQPDEITQLIAASGQGARVVAVQRILQSASDPFLGHLRVDTGDFYVRQYQDMKGSIDPEELGDTAFDQYARSCAVVLGRAHAQSPRAAAILGQVGDQEGQITEAIDALVGWSQAYAERATADYQDFLAADTAVNSKVA